MSLLGDTQKHVCLVIPMMQKQRILVDQIRRILRSERATALEIKNATGTPDCLYPIEAAMDVVISHRLLVTRYV